MLMVKQSMSKWAFAAANSLALAKAKGQNTSALEQEVAAKKAAFEKVGQDLNREG